MFDWPCKPLMADDLVAIDATRWRVFPRATVVAIAEAWNAGLNTATMAADLECRPGSIRVLIGKLTQVGVALRTAVDPSTVATREIARKRSPAAEAMAQEQFARLRRVAAWDPAARRALELYERGRKAPAVTP
jgi:hypothetical protein